MILPTRAALLGPPAQARLDWRLYLDHEKGELSLGITPSAGRTGVPAPGEAHKTTDTSVARGAL